MNLLIATGTVMVVTIIFYKFLEYVSDHKTMNRIESVIIEKNNKVKLKPKQKKEIIKITNYYYTFLFAMAAFVVFYISNLFLAILLSLVIFCIGFAVGFVLLKKYGQKIT